MPESQNNRVTPLYAESYYFTESSAGGQLANQSFGPVDGNISSQFRVTANFSTPTDKKAYAICKGQIFIQPGGSMDKINLVLKPFKQPINGLKIKYFIYRGLKKSDFLTADEDSKLVPYSSLLTGSELMNLLWKQLNDFNNWTEGDDPYDFPSSWIGYDPANQVANSFIDDYYYYYAINEIDPVDNSESKPYELPIIKAGTQLGNFNGTYGLDIVLSDGDYKLQDSDNGFNIDLSYVRASSVIIDVANIPVNVFEKQFRESILNFMDPAAFWGLHFSESGKVLVREGENIVVKVQQSIYDDIVSRFVTKNNVYMNIQSEFGRSYNYFQNYFDPQSDVIPNMTYGTSIDSLGQIQFPTNDWPILILNEDQSHAENINVLYFQFVLKTNSPVLYCEIGTLDDSAENNFLRGEGLIPEAEELEEGQPLPEINYLSKPIKIIVPAVESSGAKVNVSSFIKLLYRASDLVVSSNLAESEMHKVKEIDMLFGPTNGQLISNITSVDKVSWIVMSKKNLIDSTKTIVSGVSQLATETIIVYDKISFLKNEEFVIQDRILYDVQVTDQLGNGLNSIKEKTSSASAGSYLFLSEKNNHYIKQRYNSLETGFFYDSSSLVTSLKILSSNSQVTNNFMLGLTFEQNQLVLERISIEGLLNARIYFIENGLSVEKKFNSFDIGIIGENQLGILNVFFLEIPMVVYSIDGRYFFSREYSQFMINAKVELDIYFDI